ncbi:hypothetical protein D3C72_2528290 [compost metagenome]
MTMQGTPDAKFTAIGQDAGLWLSSQTPGQEFVMAYVHPQQCDDMIETATGERPKHP